MKLELMKNEILTTFKHLGTEFIQGERAWSVIWMANIFAVQVGVRDLDGPIPTATPDKSTVVLQIDNISQPQTAEVK